jgi:methylglutaconyl-CoA hydratase
MTSLLEATDARGIATLTLNRPERHNAFDDALIATLTDALRRLGADPAVRVVVLEAAGASFSAGADLGWMRRIADAPEAANRADAEALARLMGTLDALPKPTVAVVRGPAYGGGVGLVACCDIAIASDRARFCLSEVKLGLTPATISPYVIAAIGPRQARRWFLTAEVFDAARAQAIGLVHEVVIDAALDGTKETILRALLQGAPGAQADAKDLVALTRSTQDREGLAAETSRRIAARRASAEGREGIAAFLDRRKPVWWTG